MFKPNIYLYFDFILLMTVLCYLIGDSLIWLLIQKFRTLISWMTSWMTGLIFKTLNSKLSIQESKNITDCQCTKNKKIKKLVHTPPVTSYRHDVSFKPHIAK